jgi:hypothetical protein
MHGAGRFARSSLFIRDDDNAGERHQPSTI